MSVCVCIYICVCLFVYKSTHSFTYWVFIQVLCKPINIKVLTIIQIFFSKKISGFPGMYII